MYPPGVSRPTYRGSQQYEQPAYREPAYAEPAYVGAGSPAAGGGGSRVLKTVFVTMLLVLVPVVCGFVAYRFTAGQWPLP